MDLRGAPPIFDGCRVCGLHGQESVVRFTAVTQGTMCVSSCRFKTAHNLCVAGADAVRHDKFACCNTDARTRWRRLYGNEFGGWAAVVCNHDLAFLTPLDRLNPTLGVSSLRIYGPQCRRPRRVCPVLGL